jgi:hypothetical protein
MKKKALRKKIEDLKTENAFLLQIIAALMESVKPARGHYATFALTIGMTAEQLARLDEFWRWADLQDRSTLAKELLQREFEARMPIELRGHLEHFLQLHRKGQTPQFLFYADLVLGKAGDPVSSSA